MMKSESQNIEYKSTWKDEYLKWICGFANAHGGTIFLGINNDKSVCGINNASKLLEDLPNKIQSVLGLMVDDNLEKRENGDVLQIVTEPYPYPVNHKGRYYYRSESTMKELKGAALDKPLLSKQGKHWDGVLAPKLTISDLDAESIDIFRSLAAKNLRITPDDLKDTDEQLLNKLRLFDNKLLKKAAILFFYSDPESIVNGAYIKIGYFETDDDLKYQDEIHGNIFQQIGKTLDLLFTKYIKSNIEYEGATRIESYVYPYDAIREALLNAITHKDYSISSPIQISVYNDKLIFWNPGQFPDDWTIDNLLIKHPSIPFNPDIANTLFRSGYIESWGRGTLKILEQCRGSKLPEPLINDIIKRIWTTIKIPCALLYERKHF
jgi:ATP-dependent DNA helicase RecG